MAGRHRDDDELSLKEEETDRKPEILDPQNPVAVLAQLLEDDHSLPLLEATVKEAEGFLKVKTPALQQALKEGMDIQYLVDQAQQVKATATGTKIVLGFHGQSGVGKTSLANAILDEARVLITNTKEACTATVTSVRYNESMDPDERYIAQIIYVDQATWLRDMELSLQDIQTDQEDEETDLAILEIARAKLHAVYPDINEYDIRALQAEDLLKKLENPGALGRTIKYASSDLKKLRDTVESITKGTVKLISEEERNSAKWIPTTKGACWPLIKEIRIFLKNDLLKGGLILVDLPGSQDSNPARVAVARQFERSCTHILVVANIVRAVTDKGSHDFLNERFKEDLQQRDAWHRVTVVCTHSDQIDVDAYCQDRDAGPKIREQHAHMKSKLKQHHELLRIRGEKSQEQTSSRTQRGKVRKELKSMRKTSLDMGKDGYDLKRKVHDNDLASSSSKRVKSGSATSRPISTDRPTDDTTDDEQRLQQEQADLANRIKELDGEIADLTKDARKALKEYGQSRAELRRLCIAERNEFVIRTMKRRFAGEVRQTDRDRFEEDPGSAMTNRDYDQLGEDLTVHTVSSMAYQKRQRRFKACQEIDGFPTDRSTGLPGLQAHLKLMIDEEKIPQLRHFLREFMAHLRSLQIFTSFDEQSQDILQKKEQLQSWLSDRFAEHQESSAQKLIKSCAVIQEKMNKMIYDLLPDIINRAVELAPKKVEKWGLPAKKGGLAFGTYKATCRRGGDWKPPGKAPIDFNRDLSELAGRPAIFQQYIGIFRMLEKERRNLATEQYLELKELHHKVTTKFGESGVALQKLPLLHCLVKSLHTMMVTLLRELRGLIKKAQDEAWYLAAEFIKKDMQDIYEQCMKEKGPGSFIRIKKLMLEHIKRRGETMFKIAIGKFRKRLEELQQRMEETSNRLVTRTREYLREEFKQILSAKDDEAPGAATLMQNRTKDDLARFGMKLTGIIAASTKSTAELETDPKSTSKKKYQAYDSDEDDSSVEGGSDTDDSDDESVAEELSEVDKIGDNEDESDDEDDASGGGLLPGKVDTTDIHKKKVGDGGDGGD